MKKSSVFPRTIWRPSNLIVQFKWDTNHSKNMKKFGYWEGRAALLTYMSSTLSSDVVFLVRFPQDLRSWTWLQKVTGFPPLEKKDRSKSSSDWTRGRHNRHCRRRCTSRVYFNEYDSGSMILSITLHTKPLLAFFLLERIRISHSTMHC